MTNFKLKEMKKSGGGDGDGGGGGGDGDFGVIDGGGGDIDVGDGGGEALGSSIALSYWSRALPSSKLSPPTSSSSTMVHTLLCAVLRWPRRIHTSGPRATFLAV